MIDREDMLELTRRMTPARHCFDRLAGAYMDSDGAVDDSFNIHFGKLSPAETKRNLELAKAIPFSPTNRNLKDFPLPGKTPLARSLWQLLEALRGCALKNDALMYSLYEQIGENFRPGPGMENGYSIYLFHGRYDVPLKAADRERLWESEEVYDFLICCVSPLEGEYEPGDPVWGFLYPAFSGRSTDAGRIDIFDADPENPDPVRNIFV